MKRKIGKKLGLSKETVRTLDEMSLKEAVGGGLTATLPCGCEASFFQTCIQGTLGVCCG